MPRRSKASRKSFYFSNTCVRTIATQENRALANSGVCSQSDRNDFFVDEEERIFQAHLSEINSDAAHLGGILPRDWAIAWSAVILAEHHWGLLSDEGYEQLLEMLPLIENNPVDSLKKIKQPCYL